MGDFLNTVGSAALMMIGGGVIVAALLFHWWRRGSLAKFGVPGPVKPPEAPKT